MQSMVMLSVIYAEFHIQPLYAVMLNVVMLSVVMLSVVAPLLFERQNETVR